MSQFTPSDESGVYALVIETAGQAAILLETEGHQSSHEAAHARIRFPNTIRWAVVRLVYESGNELLLHDMKRMQK